jgi:hypothetical protein
MITNYENDRDCETEYRFIFSAKIGLIKNTDFVTYPLHYFKNTLPPKTLREIDTNIRKLDLPSDSLQYAFPRVLEKKTYFIKDRVFLSACIISTPRKIADELNFYVSSFTDTAADGYLSGDAVVYNEFEDPENTDNDINYQLVLDDIRAFVYDCDMLHKVASMKTDHFWFKV